MLDQEFCMQNLHFLLDKPDEPIFQRNPDDFLKTYPYTHVGNTLLIDNMPYKNMFNSPYNTIFLESFNNHCGEDQRLIGFVLPYLENLHSFGYGVPTFVEHNPFCRIRCIDWNNPWLFKMWFVKCSQTCQPIFYNNAKLNLKQKVLY